MSFFKFAFGPKLFKEYGNGSTQKIYEAGGLEKWGDQIMSTLSMIWQIGYYTSPILLTFLYRRGYFVTESISSIAKFTTGIGIIVIISLCMKGFGRQQCATYSRFLRALESSKTNTESGKNLIRKFDFDFKSWPVDYDVNENENEKNKRGNNSFERSQRQRSFWMSSLPCEIIAYIAIHTFGLKLIYPGSVRLLQSYFTPLLIQGRAKLIEQENATRNKIKTKDGNEIDTIFVDNRQKSNNGKTLVICCEGNAGFYEIGILSTPLSLNYSVLGWNHPGFGGSTGKPFPAQDQNAIDAIMQFALNKLNFLPKNILLYGWSIGGYPTIWAATQYPEIKGIVLDATFDDVLQLALPRMPEKLSGIVRIAIRDYVNLNHAEMINYYSGPVLMIRRTEDEIICVEENKIETNRGNFLLLSFLKYRYPLIFRDLQMAYAKSLLSKPLENSTNPEDNDDELCLSLLTSYVTDKSKSYPMLIGENYTEEQRNKMTEFLIKKHFRDYKSSHCTPLPSDYFSTPFDIHPISDNDFIFT
ncbi:phosphatidylserine lipase ABHD16A [Condylostylus longicornis]|uniref:phosphatidylserine lipase ABHD16A n=1 Tax=Condylostylus longicornis TaxID=2530218 RepID=UPI00244DFFAA|nr:phosphatidylserine lipase ABHD16A [Condylostylus longicornis]